MKVVVLCEGKTEAALRTALAGFVNRHATDARGGIATKPVPGKLAGQKFRTQVRLNCAQSDVLGVIGLTDVYGVFESGAQAKQALQETIAGIGNAEKFRPHVAQFELEAWLMPFWDEIAATLRVKVKKPGGRPEEIDKQKPPSRHLKELFRRAKKDYDKVRYASKWLTADRLEIAAQSCPELKAFLNALLELAGAELLP